MSSIISHCYSDSLLTSIDMRGAKNSPNSWRLRAVSANVLKYFSKNYYCAFVLVLNMKFMILAQHLNTSLLFKSTC